MGTESNRFHHMRGPRSNERERGRSVHASSTGKVGVGPSDLCIRKVGDKCMNGKHVPTSSYPDWIKSPHVVTCHTYFPIGKICHNFIFFLGGGGNLQLKNHKVPRSA